MRQHIWPCVIFPARYSGAYESAAWIAIAARDVPEFAQGGDVDCANFFKLNDEQIGRGDTPDTALENLVTKVGFDKHGFINEFEPAEQTTWYTEERMMSFGVS